MRETSLIAFALAIATVTLTLSCLSKGQISSQGQAENRTEYRTENYTETEEETTYNLVSVQLTPKTQWHNSNLQLTYNDLPSTGYNIPILDFTGNNIWYLGYSLTPTSENSSVQLTIDNSPLVSESWVPIIIHVYDTEDLGDIKPYNDQIPNYKISYGSSSYDIYTHSYETVENITDHAKRFLELHLDQGIISRSFGPIIDVQSNLDPVQTEGFENWVDDSNKKLNAYKSLGNKRIDYGEIKFGHTLTFDTSGVTNMAVIVTGQRANWNLVKGLTYTYTSETKTEKQVIKQRQVPYQVTY